jgi:hypothetical protein
MPSESDPRPPANTPPDIAGLPDIAGTLARLGARIERATAEAGRPAGSVTLVAVSKVQPEARIEAALAAGHRVFAENRVQEAERRWAARRPRIADLRLHLVGPLQTNKARAAVELFDVIESLDRPRLAGALADAMAATGHRPDCLIQVNTGEEAQKHGVAPAGLEALLRFAREEADLPVRGLMCIPPQAEPAAPHFALLAELAGAHGLPVLSMGMSGDYEVAIHQGATHVRLGTAVFGPRGSG